MAASMPAISVRQPWAHAIAHLGKDVENRGWSTAWRGSIAIAACAYRPDADFAHAVETVKDLTDEDLPGKKIAYGAVVAIADLTGMHHADRCRGRCSPWAQPDQFHWGLIDVRALAEPVPCKGRQRLWRLPADVERAITDQFARAE